MKTKLQLTICFIILHSSFCLSALAQGTAFTYQGRLNAGGAPASGTYDFRFRLYQDPLGNTQAGGTLFTNGVPVANGLFVVTVDFGAGIFTGSNYWLEVDVRTNDAGSYTDLNPLQGVTPAPYAIFASTASNLSGTLSPGQLSGTYGSAVTFNNTGDSFSGTFIGNGSTLTGVNALTLGGFSPNSFWQTSGNAGTTPGSSYVGTSDNEPLELRANGQRVLRLIPDTSTNNAPVIIGGSPLNYVSNSVFGATVAGGGAANFSNSVVADFGTVGGGGGNLATGWASTVAGGANNIASSPDGSATVGGGYYNTASGDSSAVGGGYNNAAGGDYAALGGGGGNTASGTYATVSGGGGNAGAGKFATVSGGNYNLANGDYSALGGGFTNMSIGEYATVSGGLENTASTWASSVGGGADNLASGPDGSATVSGGYQNTASGDSSTVPGGANNMASGDYAFVGGGGGNTASGDYATVGGYNNTASGISSAVGGGYNNTASGNSATVGGGGDNTAYGEYSFAAGHEAMAVTDGSFVWSDYSGGSFSSTVANQFAVSAAGGVVLAADVAMVGGANSYHNFSLSGGNALGYLYGSFPALADGIHLGYNYYYDNSGNGHVANSGGATSRLTAGYGFVGIYIGAVNGAPTTQRLLANSTGVTVNGTFNNSSDRNLKQNFAPISPSQILEKVGQLPVTEWSYKEDPKTRHVGPVAQDFYSTFNIGTDDKHIAPIDEGGVALAAIQGLNQKVDEQRVALQEKETEVTELKQQLDALKQLVNQINQRMDGGTK